MSALPLLLSGALRGGGGYTFRLLSGDFPIPAINCGDESWEIDLADFLRDDALDQQYLGLNKTYLVYLDHDFVGYVSLTAASIKRRKMTPVPADLIYPDCPCILVGRLGVHGDFQGQGIGPHILSWVRAEADAARMGVCFIILHVEKNNKRAQRFYEREGFDEMEQLAGPAHLLYRYDFRRSVVQEFDAAGRSG